MDTSTEDQTVISDELWRAWGRKDRLREAAVARKQRVVAAIVIALIAVGSAVYFVVAR